MEVSTCKEKKKQELFLEDVLSITHKKWFVNRFIEKSLKKFLVIFLYPLLYFIPFVFKNAIFALFLLNKIGVLFNVLQGVILEYIEI